ncbi:GntR family transcriptional regulator [Marispirochaeta sp.]|jgi:GntR family transcriptional regulator, rspAB operon transcriptional repressor|uniref:GntR family transcriptional regulator n=1 Tax=Marispirochaeta sp. TaxID=2038653 RepID=UPI0029C649EF|nr:GntR family transcriptional regulator [Marispirochaeta sp.]
MTNSIKKSSVGEESVFITTAERVYNSILKMILAGEYPPGSRLPRRKLAERTQSSQIPVLEAMKRLEQEGLVEYKAQWGCVVTVPTAQKVKDMYVLREAVECQVARILAITLTREKAQELYELAKTLDGTPYSEDTQQQIYDTHYRFHLLMAQLTGHETLVKSLRQANLFWLLMSSVQWRRGSKAEVQSDWHKRLVDVILKGDPLEADSMMREHIQDAYVPILKQMGDDFPSHA